MRNIRGLEDNVTRLLTCELLHVGAKLSAIMVGGKLTQTSNVESKALTYACSQGECESSLWYMSISAASSISIYCFETYASAGE